MTLPTLPTAAGQGDRGKNGGNFASNIHKRVVNGKRTGQLQARAMLCSGLALLVAACGGGSGSDGSESLSAVNASATANAATVPAAAAPAATDLVAANTTAKPSATTSSTTTASTTIAAPPTTYNFYVSTSGSDSNAGTQAAPFKTILKASQVAVPDSTIHVAAGSYTGGFQTTKSGTASSRIRYVSDAKWGAKIVGSSGNENIWDNRGDYVDIDGFEIDGTNATPVTIGIYLGGSYATVKNNLVHHIATTISCVSHGAGGIETDNYFGGVKNDVLNNVVHHVGSNGCGFYQGIYVSTSGKVSNNLVYAVSNTGITSWHNATNLTITNNTVFGNGQGITIGSGDTYNGFSGSNDYSIVANNIVYDNTGTGIDEEGATGTHNVYANNLSFGNGTNWSLKNGLTGTGTISADPQFVNYIRTGGGDYHLKSTSPAISKGSLTYATLTDIVGTVRAASVDLGAYNH